MEHVVWLLKNTVVNLKTQTLKFYKEHITKNKTNYLFYSTLRSR